MSTYLARRCGTVTVSARQVAICSVLKWTPSAAFKTPSIAEAPCGRQLSDQLLLFVSVHPHCLHHLPKDKHHLRFSPDMNELYPVDPTENNCRMVLNDSSRGA